MKLLRREVSEDRRWLLTSVEGLENMDQRPEPELIQELGEAQLAAGAEAEAEGCPAEALALGATPAARA